MVQHGIARFRSALVRGFLAGAACGLCLVSPVAAQTDGTPDGTGVAAAQTLPVAPLQASINAAAYAPMPQGAAFVIQRYDDSREHDAIAAALSRSIGQVAGHGATALPLEMTFDLYVIRSGVPVMAKGLLDEPWRGPASTSRDQAPPGIDVTALQGRSGAVEGNVFHQREDSFAATMRLMVTVSDPMDGAYLWRGWADSTMNGLSRAQVAGLLADPLMATLGQTVADQAVRLRVPSELGGPAPEPTPAQ
jgi:hypothetical protein